jgi:hypothetical protein
MAKKYKIKIVLFLSIVYIILMNFAFFSIRIAYNMYSRLRKINMVQEPYIEPPPERIGRCRNIVIKKIVCCYYVFRYCSGHKLSS